MPVQRNIAHDIPFVLLNRTTGAVLTGATITGYRVLDGGIQSAVEGSIVEKSNGQYLFEGVANDFNAEFTSGLLFTASNAIPVHILIQTGSFRKNIAYDIPFLLLNISSGAALTGASPTGKRCLDGGSQQNVSGTFVERGNGQYVFQAAVADFNASDIIGILITVAGGIALHLMIDLVESYISSDTYADTPAAILREYLILQGLVTLPSVAGNWPMYVSSMPDGDNVDDNAGAAYNTTPIKDGRLMAGAVIQHYGVQIKIRAVDETTGWNKCSAIAAEFDRVHNASVVHNGTTYLLENISQTTGINSLGTEPGTKRRELFTMNYIVTLKQSS